MFIEDVSMEDIRLQPESYRHLSSFFLYTFDVSGICSFSLGVPFTLFKLW